MIHRLSTPALLVFASALLCGTLTAKADYEPKHKSQFEEAKVVRNVFWPIGYVPAKLGGSQTVATAKPVAKLSADQFVVSSILIGGGLPLAVINGKDLAVGDLLVVEGASVQVAAIRDGFVVLRHEGTEIEAPLKQ